ncbi:MAG: response regulator transcription factor [Nitriliruptoraceae bacterium]
MPATFLDAGETSAVRHVVDRCATRTAGTELVFDVLDDLQELIGCDWVAFNRHDTAGRRLHHAQRVAEGERELTSPEQLEAEDREPFWRWYWRCEPCSLPDRVEAPVVVSISEFYTAREWTQHPMSEVLKGVSDELLVSYPDAPGQSRRLLFAREGGGRFGERERFLMTLLMPHIGPLLARTITPPHQDAALTERQREVLQLVRLGMANKEIAQALRISVGTVRKHLENIYERLDVQSRTEAVREVALDEHPPRISQSA